MSPPQGVQSISSRRGVFSKGGLSEIELRQNLPFFLKPCGNCLVWGGLNGEEQGRNLGVGALGARAPSCMSYFT